jgi:hypothetical protein
MAKAQFHPLLKGVNGASGDLVFRQVYGNTFIVRRPDTEKPREASALQQAQRARFNAARVYALKVLQDPLRRRVYQALAKTLNRRFDKVVEGDFLTPPVVEEIDVSQYQGQPGGLIQVLATDDIEVVAVTVAVRTPGGTVLEQGPAEKSHGIWQYRATVLLPPGETVEIAATARDRPGHDGAKSIEWRRL